MPIQKWIIINDKKYDVSTFMKSHPGGEKIINENLYSDMTSQFTTFHHNSKRALAVLHSLHCDSLHCDSLHGKTITTQHNNNFMKLFSDIKGRGLLNHSYLIVILQIVDVYMYYIASVYLLYVRSFYLSAIMMGVCHARSGFVMHFGGHYGLTGNRNIDTYIGTFFMCFVNGGSLKWWKTRHNKHHVFTNDNANDPDLKVNPLLVYDIKRYNSKFKYR